MNFRKVFAACLLISLLGNHVLLHAFETDQYNLPHVPLADIGDEVSEYIEEQIRYAIGQLNARIASKQACLSNLRRPEGCSSPEREQRRLTALRSEAAVAHEVYKRLGAGIFPTSKLQSWVNSHKFGAQPARYKTSYTRSVFALIPTNYLTISPTVKMYGSSFGTDKIGHIFQQGYGYYSIRRKALEGGQTEAAATRKAVEHGVFSEHTYYGTFVGGVFSNADLVANYVGMMFYEGLTKTLPFGEVVRPAVVELTDGKWKFNEAARTRLLRPLISDHLNEALNPSLFIPGLRSSIRRVVRRQSCPQWLKAFPVRTQREYETYSHDLTRWRNQDYGFRESSRFVSIANTCF